MDYVLRPHNRAAVLTALKSGEYEAIATSSQSVLDELVHLAIEVGVFEALELIRVKRERRGIPDELLLRTIAVLPFVEALGVSAAAGELFKDAAILLQLGRECSAGTGGLQSTASRWCRRHEGDDAL